MRKDIIFSGCIFLALLSATPAFAQEFSGPHAGVQGGWEQTDLRNPDTDPGPVAIDDDRQSFTGGVFVGYDRPVAPRIVLGVEGGMDVSTGDALASTNGAGFVSIDPRMVDRSHHARRLPPRPDHPRLRPRRLYQCARRDERDRRPDMAVGNRKPGWLAPRRGPRAEFLQKSPRGSNIATRI